MASPIFRVALAAALVSATALLDVGCGDSSGPTGRVIGVSAFGSKCLSDGECGRAGVVCLTSTGTVLGNFGPAGGVCTRSCQTTDDCTGIDPNASCVGLTDTQSFCMEGCTIGSPATTDTKCHNRPDMACAADPNAPNVPFCVPVCRGDFDCPGGRGCDPASGLCADQPSTGLPIGAACDPTATPTPCAGFCVQLDTGIGICSEPCANGTDSCGAAPGQAGPLDAACLWISDPNAGMGDLGDCGQLCDCDADCANDKLVCSPLPVDVAGFYGRAGFCGLATDPSTNTPAQHIPVCPLRDGGASADAGAARDGGARSRDAGARDASRSR